MLIIHQLPPVGESSLSACQSDAQASVPPSTCESVGETLSVLGLSDSTYLNAEPPLNSQNAKIKSSRGSKFNPNKHLTEVKGIELYVSTIVVRRHSKMAVGGGKRREIFNLSADSLGRLAFIAFNTAVNFRSMMTLTYPGEFTNDGRQVKQDLNALLVWYRRNFPGGLYLWWLEFQKRGAPHLHLLSNEDLESHGKLSTITRSNGETWLTHWATWQTLEQVWRRFGGGMTAWEVINDAEGGKKYAAKYATKAYQKAVPPAYRNVGRFWGHSRDGVKPEPGGFYQCNEAQLREALKRGCWEHLPGDGEVLYRELFQAASAIDLTTLPPVSDLPAVKYPKPVKPKHVYVCEHCSVTTDKWSGQCVSCGEWNSLVQRIDNRAQGVISL